MGGRSLNQIFRTRNFRGRAIIAFAAAVATGIRMQTARSVELCLWGTELALERAPRRKSIAVDHEMHRDTRRVLRDGITRRKLV